MLEEAFEQSYSVSLRIAGVHAARLVRLLELPADARCDLEQEALLELWRKACRFDSRRASWRTFAERVVANRLTSLVRRLRSGCSGYGKEDSLDGREFAIPAIHDLIDLRTDIGRVLVGVSLFDRLVAACLLEYSVSETSQKLGASRARVYRAIGRLRVAFGLALGRRRAYVAYAPNCHQRSKAHRQERRA
jgi:DNA-directed RNA polymerase specialized sigma24 family protein